MGKRDDIMYATLDIIIERGVRGLTLPLLFERAQTGPGTFYHYFKDINHLMDALHEYCCELGNQIAEEADNPEAPVRERFGAVVSAACRACCDHLREMRYVYWCAYGLLGSDISRSYLLPPVDRLSEIIEKAQQEGLVTNGSPAMVSARMICGMIASCLWGAEQQYYELTPEAINWFVDRAWHLIEVKYPKPE